MSDEKVLSRVWLKIIPTLILIGLLGWCTHNGRKAQEIAPLKAELQNLFMEAGLVDSSNQQQTMESVAKNLSEQQMNRLLYDAASSSSIDVLRWLIKNGADPKNVGVIGDQTLLQKVAQRPRMDRLELFLSYGLNPLERSRDGRTLLHAAAQGGLDPTVLQLLLSKGLKIDDTDIAGRTPLHVASVKSVSVLVSGGANIEVADLNGMTPLLLASKEGRLEDVTELINNGASVFAKDKNGRTPLHHAVLARNPEKLVETLLAAGSPVTVRDNEGMTPKEIAQEKWDNYSHSSVMDRL